MAYLGAQQDEEEGPAVQGPTLPGEVAKMSKLFDDPDKLNLASCPAPAAQRLPV